VSAIFRQAAVKSVQSFYNSDLNNDIFKWGCFIKSFEEYTVNCRSDVLGQ